MILKPADDKFSSIAKLEVLLKTGRVPPDKVALVEKELRLIKSGIKGEEESAYLIDFYLRDSKNTTVLHDLRFELQDGRVGQIDHLLIHRSYRFYVLETKNFSHGIKITDEGEFLRWNDWKKNFEGIPSPIAQNDRHALVLEKVLESLGLPAPTIRSYILIAPTARIDRSKQFDSSMVVKADQFLEALEKDLAGTGVMSLLGGIAKATWNGSAEEIGRKLGACHKPIVINYIGKFGLARPQVTADTLESPHIPAAVVTTQTAQTPALAPAQRSPTTTATPVEKAPAHAPTLTAQPAIAVAHTCRSCGKEDLTIEYGKYGYYFKCQACAGNTPIKVACGNADHKERLRKEGPRFYRECAGCNSSSLFFVNAK